MLYILGLSYGSVADLLESLRFPLSKSTVYEIVQAAGQRAIHLRQQWWHQLAGHVQVLGINFTHVKCLGQDRILAVATAVLTGEPLTFDLLQSESALHAEQWIHDLAHLVSAEILVTDDTCTAPNAVRCKCADGLKTVADELEVRHQICRAHVNRNVCDLIATLGTKALEHPDPVPWELKGVNVSMDQFLEDLQTAEFVVAALPFDG